MTLKMIFFPCKNCNKEIFYKHICDCPKHNTFIYYYVLCTIFFDFFLCKNKSFDYFFFKFYVEIVLKASKKQLNILTVINLPD